MGRFWIHPGPCAIHFLGRVPYSGPCAPACESGGLALGASLVPLPAVLAFRQVPGSRLPSSSHVDAGLPNPVSPLWWGASGIPWHFVGSKLRWQSLRAFTTRVGHHFWRCVGFRAATRVCWQRGARLAPASPAAACASGLGVCLGHPRTSVPQGLPGHPSRKRVASLAVRVAFEAFRFARGCVAVRDARSAAGPPLPRRHAPRCSRCFRVTRRAPLLAARRHWQASRRCVSLGPCCCSTCSLPSRAKACSIAVVVPSQVSCPFQVL